MWGHLVAKSVNYSCCCCWRFNRRKVAAKYRRRRYLETLFKAVHGLVPVCKHSHYNQKRPLEKPVSDVICVLKPMKMCFLKSRWFEFLKAGPAGDEQHPGGSENNHIFKPETKNPPISSAWLSSSYECKSKFLCKHIQSFLSLILWSRDDAENRAVVLRYVVHTEQPQHKHIKIL